MDISEKSNRSYTNGEITVYWQPKYCIHAGECYTRLPKVFKPSSKPWVDLSESSTPAIIKTVDACPTDALTYKWNKDLIHVSEDNENNNETIDGTDGDRSVVITLMKGGPYRITGDFVITDENKNVVKKGVNCSLCGCGKTKRAPFCDGSHSKS